MEAVARFAQAREFDPELKISADSWSDLCWAGATRNQAALVMPACEQAVAGASEDEEELAEGHANRGLARALTGDIPGALEDFRFVVEQIPGNWEEEQAIVAGWIECLENGGNPFSDEVLEKLRQ